MPIINSSYFGSGGGTDTSDATATASRILAPYTAYVASGKVTGTMPSQGAQTITPGTTNQTIQSGRYLSGTQTILGDIDLVPANIRTGISIFWVAGKFNGLSATLTVINNQNYDAYVITGNGAYMVTNGETWNRDIMSGIFTVAFYSDSSYNRVSIIYSENIRIINNPFTSTLGPLLYYYFDASGGDGEITINAI